MTADKKSGVLYNMAKQAKRRMKNYSQGGIKTLSYAKLASSDKDQALYKKVCKLLEEDHIIINPINELIDKNEIDFYYSLIVEESGMYLCIRLIIF